ncbi:unnamed protein product [Leptidea sinapis]|uniref:Uncharacterized protein n=1 Tax=Leptidea sinapis TaxID=189913 RepID=A0A5E4R2Z6_9NEOP|nr:unnamed protein product [Leptidea sinapis]
MALVVLVKCMLGVESKPLFGLLDLFGATEIANGTSVLSALALAHAAHTIDKFLALADLAQYALNTTASLG